MIEVGTDTSIKEAAELMVAHNIHHLLVVENDAIKGIVSSIDFIGELLLKKAELQ
ncbi:CBS domain-containing protein [Shewanella sediminis]|uniref:CBS domain-containing protein n=1 Tax=Shewanella sediminis TaxID=271097 RepID=UPI000A02D7C2